MQKISTEIVEETLIRNVYLDAQAYMIQLYIYSRSINLM